MGEVAGAAKLAGPIHVVLAENPAVGGEEVLWREVDFCLGKGAIPPPTFPSCLVSLLLMLIGGVHWPLRLGPSMPGLFRYCRSRTIGNGGLKLPRASCSPSSVF